MERLIELPPSPISSVATSGDDFRALLFACFDEVRVIDRPLAFVRRIERRDDTFVVTDWDDVEDRAKHVVFAPAGAESGGPDALDGDALYGRGVSQDAWSDALCIQRERPGAPVAVLGSGLRAAEEALIAARAGLSVSIVCEDAPRFGFLDEQIRSARIECLSQVRLLGYRKNDERLEAVRVMNVDGVERWLPCHWLFLARSPVCDWSAVGNRAQGAASGVVLAGLANDVPHDDYPALIADAHRAAEAVMALRRNPHFR